MATYRVPYGSMGSTLKPSPLDPRTGYSEKTLKRLAKTRRARVCVVSRVINAEVHGTKLALCQY